MSLGHWFKSGSKELPFLYVGALVCLPDELQLPSLPRYRADLHIYVHGNPRHLELEHSIQTILNEMCVFVSSPPAVTLPVVTEKQRTVLCRDDCVYVCNGLTTDPS